MGETALVKSQPTSISAYEPKDIDSAMALAKTFADSRLVANVTTQSRAMLVMATGADLGLSATTALRSIHIIEDKPSISAQLKLALCLRRKDLCAYFREIESDDSHAVYETLRVGDDIPIRQEFTIQDARRMGLKVDTPASAWHRFPRRMLRWRCIGELADRVYPEILLGLPSTEDLLDEQIIDMKPIEYGSITGAIAAVSQSAETAKEARREERREEANAIEPLDEAFGRWQASLDAASTTAECDRIAGEIRKRVAKDTPEYERGKELVGAAKKRLRTVHERPVSTEPVVERVPGEDDE